jgi:hypothetical protein
MFPILLLWKNSSDHGSYIWVMNMLLIYLSFMQGLKKTIPKQRLLFWTIFFLDRSQNYESNGTGFIIFGASNRELWIFKV